MSLGAWPCQDSCLQLKTLKLEIAVKKYSCILYPHNASRKSWLFAIRDQKHIHCDFKKLYEIFICSINMAEIWWACLYFLPILFCQEHIASSPLAVNCVLDEQGCKKPKMSFKTCVALECWYFSLKLKRCEPSLGHVWPACAGKTAEVGPVLCLVVLFEVRSLVFYVQDKAPSSVYPVTKPPSSYLSCPILSFSFILMFYVGPKHMKTRSWAQTFTHAQV